MAKSKVLDLAQEAGMKDDKLLLKLKRMGVKLKDKKLAEPEKKASLSEEKIIGRNDEREITEKRVKPTVIRRRTRTLEVKEEMLAPSPATDEKEELHSVEKTPQRKKGEESVGEDLTLSPNLSGEKELKKKASLVETEGVPSARNVGDSIPSAKVGEHVVPSKVVSPQKGETTGVKKEGSADKLEEVPIKKIGVKLLEKEEIEERERLAALLKKKGIVKKKKRIEERMLVEEEVDGDKPEGKEIEPSIRTFRPMKKKLVLKSSKKTEVTVPKPIKRIIRIAEAIGVGDLAKRMGVKGGELIKKLMGMGVMVNINQLIDADMASLVASEFGYEVEKTSLEHQELLERKEDLEEQLKQRPPVVTIMGHVDHGKTMLLDSIRKTNVMGGEAGGITQHIGAYDVELEKGHVVFIDTPGHEAFTAMRARGAQVTDVVVLVVAADDGMMPQTKEAIDHSRAAKVPIVVAINKVDKPTANPEKVKKELSEYGLVPEQWGGTTLYAEVSAKQKIGIKELLDSILLQSEILELKANPDKPARGIIIEAKLDKGRGPVATVIVQEGTLKTGDAFLAGSYYGKVRAMLNDRGQKIEQAGPSIPVEVVGFSDIPDAGESFIVVSEERMAKQISLYRQEKIREKELSKLSKVSLEELYDKIKKGEVRELNVIVKADVQGSIEAVKEAFNKLSTDTVKVNILHDAVGGITETDVNLASASNAIIIGFNVRPGPKGQLLADQEHVDIRTYSIIYDAVTDVKNALEGLLEPTYKEHILGRAQVIQVFNIKKTGAVAGSLVTDGKVVRGSHARLLRDNVVIYSGKIVSLRRFKDDMKDCSQGLECGIGIENYNDLKLGDVIESYEIEEIQTRLS